MKGLLELCQNALTGAAMLGTSTSGSLSMGTPQQPSPAGCKGGDEAMTSAPESAAQLMGRSSRGDAETSQQACPGPDLDRPPAAGPQREESSPAGDSDVISLMSSTQPIHADKLFSDDEDDGEASMGSHGRKGSPAVGASVQPPAARAAPAVNAVVVSVSANNEDIVIDLENSESEHAPGGPSAPAGRAASPAQASSAAQASSYLPNKPGSPQAEHLQVLLHAPGIKPTAICLIRQGDVDWLSSFQIGKVLLGKVLKADSHAKKRPGSRRPATCEERAFLAAKGVFRVPRSKVTLVDIEAACSLLQRKNAPASTLAAVQGLQGAQPLTPAEISSPSPGTALQSGEDGGSSEDEEHVPLASRPGRNSHAPLAVQRPDQAACMHQQGAAAAMGAPCSLDAPETPVRTQQENAAGGAKRSSSEAFGACAESLLGSKSLKAAGSSEEKECAAGLPRADPPCAIPTRANPPRRAQVAAKKTTFQTHQRAPDKREPVAQAEDEHVSSPSQIAARAAKQRPEPFGMGADGQPTAPLIVEDPELVAEQENLVANIFSRKAYEDYQRRWGAVRGLAVPKGMVSEYFLRSVVSYNKTRSDKAKNLVVQQVAKWLASSPEQRREHMYERTLAVELTNTSHPAYRRFKEVLQPLGLRQKEQALHFCKSLPEWTLLGEYCGVWDRQVPASEAEETDAPDIGDPLGLGPLLYDKVSDLACSSKEAPKGATDALRAKWADALQLDPSRANNQLCLINDFRGVPGAPDGNVIWVEMEDSRTLQPHLFIFTAVSVKAGQEVLLDYGVDYHKDMEAPLNKAAHLVETQPDVMAVHRALKAREHEALDRAREVQDLQKALHQEGAERVRLEEEAVQLKAQVEEERARVAGMHQLFLRDQEESMAMAVQADTERAQLAKLKAEAEEEQLRANRVQQISVQGQAAAQKLGKSIADELKRLTDQAEQERARTTCVQQQLVQAQEAASRLKEEAEEKHAGLTAQAEEERARTTSAQQQLVEAQEAASRVEEAAKQNHRRLNAQANTQWGRAACAQQQLVQAQKTASRLKEEAKEEHTRLKAEAEEERGRATCMRQQLVQTQEAANRLMTAAKEEHARLRAQTDTAVNLGHRLMRLSKEKDAVQEQALAQAASDAARVQELEILLQERNVALQQARTEAQSSGKALHELHITHQDMCERSAAEIDRLSKIGRGFELELAQLTMQSPPGMEIVDLLAPGDNNPADRSCRENSMPLTCHCLLHPRNRCSARVPRA